MNFQRAKRCRPPILVAIRSSSPSISLHGPFAAENWIGGSSEDEHQLQATGGGAKHYHRGIEPEVDQAIDQFGITLHERDPFWRDVVNALCDVGEYRLAERAQRHAVPILEDLIGAVRSDQVRDMFDSLTLAETSEKATKIFERLSAAVRRRA